MARALQVISVALPVASLVIGVRRIQREGAARAFLGHFVFSRDITAMLATLFF
jgi:hypothetical protein